MKKISITVISVLVLLFLVTCKKAKKDFNDYLPKVKITSATVQTDGSVLVLGEVESSGEAAIDRIGMCCSTNDTPEMLDRQIICNVADNRFSASFIQLSVDSSYHFRPWASNKFGYAYGNILTLDSIIVPEVTPPCTLTPNTLNTGTTFGTGVYGGAPSPVGWNGALENYQFGASTTNLQYGINVYLKAPLGPGIYTTTMDILPGYREMYFSFTDGSFNVLQPGTPIYVNKIGTNLYDITVCDARWLFNSTTILYLNTRLYAHN